MTTQEGIQALVLLRFLMGAAGITATLLLRTLSNTIFTAGFMETIFTILPVVIMTMVICVLVVMEETFPILTTTATIDRISTTQTTTTSIASPILLMYSEILVTTLVTLG
jgi:hypothetical protein